MWVLVPTFPVSPFTRTWPSPCDSLAIDYSKFRARRRVWTAEDNSETTLQSKNYPPKKEPLRVRPMTGTGEDL